MNMSNTIKSTHSDEPQVEVADKKQIIAAEITLKKTDVDLPTHASEKSISATPREINGPKGLEPTRYGDWESKGRCYDF